MLRVLETNEVASRRGPLRLTAASSIELDDHNKVGSTWGVTRVLRLSNTLAEWSQYKANYGEVSLLNALNQAHALATIPYSALGANQDDLPSVAAVLDTTSKVYLGAGETILFNSPPTGETTFAPSNSVKNMVSNSRLSCEPGASVRFDMTYRFGLYGRANLGPGGVVASPPVTRATRNNVIISEPWVVTPAVGDVAWVEHYIGETPQVSGCSYDVRGLGVATIGSTDVTAVALFGGGGTLNGLTLKLNVDGSGEQTLTFSGVENSASTDALLAAILTKWPTLWQVGLGGASGKTLVIASQTIVIGAGTANAALGITAGTPTYAAALLDRSIAWAHGIGDKITCAAEFPKDIVLDFSAASVTGYANQPIEFTQAQRVKIDGLSYKLSRSEIPYLGGIEGIAAIGFDIASRDCALTNSTIYFPNDPPYPGGTGIYFQSNDGSLLLNDRFSNALLQGYSFMDCYASNVVATITRDCTWGHVFQKFDDNSFGCVDCSVVASSDIGSAVGLWVWGGIRIKAVAFSSTKNSQYGLHVDRDCGPTSYTNVSFTHSDIGVYVEAGVDGTSLSQLNTDECRIGLQVAGSIAVSMWHHHSTRSSPSSLLAFVSGTGVNTFRDIDLQNTSGGNGIYVPSANSTLIDGGRIAVGATGYCLQVDGGARVRVANIVFSGGLGINCTAGLVEIGPGCDFSAATTAFAVSGTGRLTFQQTGGVLAFTSSNRFILLSECYNTTIEVAVGAAGDVAGIPGIAGLQFVIVNNKSTAFQVVSSAAGDTGVTVAANKTAIVRVDSTLHCKRVTADT